MLHEPLKPAANCLSGGLIGKQKQRSCRCFNWCSQSSPVGLHGFDSSCSQCPDGRGQCYCHLHSVGAAASQGAPAGARVSKQLEPCREKAFPSSWSWIPAVCGRWASRWCNVGEMQNSGECSTGSCKNSGEVKSTSVNTMTGTWWQCSSSSECRLLRMTKKLLLPEHYLLWGLLYVLQHLLDPLWAAQSLRHSIQKLQCLGTLLDILDICWW